MQWKISACDIKYNQKNYLGYVKQLEYKYNKWIYKKRISTEFSLLFCLNNILNEEELLKDNEDTNNANPDLNHLYICDKLQVSYDIANFIGFYFLGLEIIVFILRRTLDIDEVLDLLACFFTSFENGYNLLIISIDNAHYID